MPHEIILREQYGLNGRELVYVKPPDQNTIVQLDSAFPRSRTMSLCYGIRSFFCTVFLPQGYPESVSEDYLPYQVWDTVQAFASTMNGILTTHAIMRGVGVGDQAASPLAAAVTWVLKDGAGNIGRILFAWWKGTSLDADCKKWRLFADVLNDFAMCLELLLPYFMGYSTALLCTATVLKSIVGVTGGATRAALTQHQAIRDNMADVSAKDSSQETCVNLIASVFGILLLMTLDEKRYVWPMFVFFTAVHLYSNYKAVKSLTMFTLNKARLNLIIREYLTTNRKISVPWVINKKESIILGQGLSDIDLCGYKIKVGESLSTLVHKKVVTADQLKLLINLYSGHSYLIVIAQEFKEIFVSLKQGCVEVSFEAIQAYFHAVLLGVVLNILEGKELLLLNAVKEDSESPITTILDSVHQIHPKPSLQAGPQKLELEAVMSTNKLIALDSKVFLKNLEKAGKS